MNCTIKNTNGNINNSSNNINDSSNNNEQVPKKKHKNNNLYRSKGNKNKNLETFIYAIEKQVFEPKTCESNVFLAI